MSSQRPIDPDADGFSFVDAEHHILEFWQSQDIFQKSLQATQDNEPYIFYDGPPFATGLPHHGHLVGSILKDAVPRYFTMQGRYVQRRFGWDCHGLPIEHEIDKSLGLSSAEAVEKLGIKGYNDACRGIIQRYTQEWRKTISRIGRWVDFDNDYKTMEPWYMESVWWVVQQLWNKDLIYRGEKVVPFSTALGTVLSNFEAGSNYQETQDPAVTVLFKLCDEQDTFIAAWTTTPWTLPSNLALCVGDDITYSKVLDETLGVHIIIASDRLPHYENQKSLTVVETFLGALSWSAKPMIRPSLTSSMNAPMAPFKLSQMIMSQPTAEQASFIKHPHLERMIYECSSRQELMHSCVPSTCRVVSPMR